MDCPRFAKLKHRYWARYAGNNYCQRYERKMKRFEKGQ